MIDMTKREYDRVFDICPGPAPGDNIVPDMKENTPLKELMDMHKMKLEEQMSDERYVVFEWVIPKNMHIMFDPEDITSEMMFVPNSADTFTDENIKKGFIRDGLTIIYIKKKDTGKNELVYAGSPIFCDMESPVSKFGARRRYQKKNEAHPGDIVKVSFLATKKINTRTSIMDSRVTIKLDK